MRIGLQPQNDPDFLEQETPDLALPREEDMTTPESTTTASVGLEVPRFQPRQQTHRTQAN
jgi:hypothetical protein